MQPQDFSSLKEYIPVPAIFHSFTTGKPFDRCISCEKNLLENGTQYVIEKAFRQYPDYGVSDVIYEYAMCVSCTGVMQNTLSRKSLSIINKYLESRVNLAERRKNLLSKSGMDTDAWLSHCLISGKPVTRLAEYQIYGHCDGSDLLFTYLPYMISSDALEGLNDLISSETRDILNNFIDTHFGLPPEYRELIKSRKKVLF